MRCSSDVAATRDEVDHHRDAPDPKKNKDATFDYPMRDLIGERMAGDESDDMEPETPPW